MTFQELIKKLRIADSNIKVIIDVYMQSIEVKFINRLDANNKQFTLEILDDLYDSDTVDAAIEDALERVK